MSVDETPLCSLFLTILQAEIPVYSALNFKLSLHELYLKYTLKKDRNNNSCIYIRFCSSRPSIVYLVVYSFRYKSHTSVTEKGTNSENILLQIISFNINFD